MAASSRSSRNVASKTVELLTTCSGTSAAPEGKRIEMLLAETSAQFRWTSCTAVRPETRDPLQELTSDTASKQDTIGKFKSTVGNVLQYELWMKAQSN